MDLSAEKYGVLFDNLQGGEMNQWKWAGLLAVIVAASSQAATTARTQLCWGTDGIEATAFDNCAFTFETNGSTASTVERTTPNPDGVSPDQVFVGTGTATATPDTWRVAMSLDVSDYRRDMYIWTESPTLERSAPTTAAITADSTDSVTISGGTGVYSLKYIFSLDGLRASSDPNLISATFCSSLSIPTGTGSVTGLCRSFGQDVPGSFTLSYDDLPFGGPIEPTVSISVFGFIEAITASEAGEIGAQTFSASASAQFGSTVRLTSLLVTDASGVPIAGLQVSSQSGFDYPVDPRNLAPVPEPSTLLLMACGLGLFGLRWVRARALR